MMNSTQKQSWSALKQAVDKYSQATGAEVAVATTFYAVGQPKESHAFGDSKQEAIVYGHGGLCKEVKEALVRKGPDTTKSWNIHDVKNLPFSSSHDNLGRSLSSSFRTLRLDPRGPPEPASRPLEEGGRTPGKDPPPGRSGRKKSKKKPPPSSELELDENLLFGEENEPPSSGSSDDSDEIGELHQRPIPRPAVRYDQLATSLPVSINMNWGDSRFRDNQGPHPPAYNQPIRAQPPGPRTIRAEQTPQPDTMMASMQALARSVTDDSALIFGERPRPRVHNEPIRAMNKKQ